MVVTKQEALLHEEHGAIMKHKCGKYSSIVPSLFFALFFIWALGPLFLALWPLFLFPHTGKCSNNDDHHTFIYSQLKAQNDGDSIGNASGSVPGCATI